MKKILNAAVLCIFAVGIKLYAGEGLSAPYSNNSNPINADYGGVEMFVTSFTIANNISTVGLPGNYGQFGSFLGNPPTNTGYPAGQFGNIASTTTASYRDWRIYGAYFSTGNCSSADFIEVYQSTGGFKDTNTLVALRFYNSYGSTVTAPSGGAVACSGIQTTRWPIRMKGNIFVKGSANTYNQMGILYWREPD